MTRPLLAIAAVGFAVALAATSAAAAPRGQTAWRNGTCQLANPAPQSRSHGHFGGHYGGRHYDRRAAPPRRHVPPPPPWGYMSPPRHYYDDYYQAPRHYRPRYHEPRWYDPYDRHWR